MGNDVIVRRVIGVRDVRIVIKLGTLSIDGAKRSAVAVLMKLRGLRKSINAARLLTTIASM